MNSATSCYICQGGMSHCGKCDCCSWNKVIPRPLAKVIPIDPSTRDVVEAIDLSKQDPSDTWYSLMEKQGLHRSIHIL